MKYVCSAVALLSLASTGALAADLPTRRAPPPPPVVAVAPPFSWTGFYIGANAGYAFEGRHDYNIVGADPALANLVGTIRPGFVRNTSNGFTGGGQIGYNYQLPFGPTGGFVMGVEADIAYTDQRYDNFSTGTNGSVSNFRSNTDYVGTARGRAGIAIGNGLVYGTGGFAYGQTHDTANFFSPAGALYYSGSTSAIRTGYVFGAGIEYALPSTSLLNFFGSNAVTVKLEGLHYDLGSSILGVNNVSGGAAVGTGYTERVRYSGNIVRFGLNYKFGFNPVSVPVVARY